VRKKKIPKNWRISPLKPDDFCKVEVDDSVAEACNSAAQMLNKWATPVIE
jgi:hypothetical protein